jgi:hypothetical protein
MIEQSKHLEQAIKCLNEIENKDSAKDIMLIREALTSLHYELEIRINND